MQSSLPSFLLRLLRRAESSGTVTHVSELISQRIFLIRIFDRSQRHARRSLTIDRSSVSARSPPGSICPEDARRRECTPPCYLPHMCEITRLNIRIHQGMTLRMIGAITMVLGVILHPHLPPRLRRPLLQHQHQRQLLHQYQHPLATR